VTAQHARRPFASLRGGIDRRPVLAYFACAYAISWLLWLPAVATRQEWWAWSVPAWWHYLGAAGPISAAVVVATRTEERRGLRALIDQYRPGRTTAGWLLFGFGSPILLFALGAVVAWVADGTWPSYGAVAKTGNLPALGLPLTLLVHLLTFAVGEETGWRGYALPQLLRGRTALRATLLLAAGWGLWHLPTFFENADMQGLGIAGTAGWSIGLVLGAIFLTWLYQSSGRSLLVVVLWHGLFNTLIASEAAEGVIAAVMTTGIMVGAVAILVRTGSGLRGFSRDQEARQPGLSQSLSASQPPPMRSPRFQPK
jgi:uncharacterized protein